MALVHISTVTSGVRGQLLGSVLDSLDVRDVFRLAGYEQPDRHGFVQCPLHEERSASFHVAPSGRGWRCFGCDRRGGVLDLVIALGIACDRAGAARWLEEALR